MKNNDDIILLNLSVYKILKVLNSAGYSDNQLNKFINLIDEEKISFDSILTFIKDQVSSSNIIHESIEKIKDVFIELEKNFSISFDEFNIILHCCLNLLLFKNKILKITSDIENFSSENVLNSLNIFTLDNVNITDLLSLDYDSYSLNIPYLRRVFSIISTTKLFNGDLESFHKNIDNDLDLSELNASIKNINILNNSIFNNQLNIESIFYLIIAESLSQSSRQSGGDSFEKRIFKILEGVADPESIEIGTHDKNYSEVEYDFKFTLDGIPIGISAKRTSRERYKQNLMDIENLEVDALIFITLGTDLRETIVEEILNKSGSIIIVPQETYDKEFKDNNNYSHLIEKIIPHSSFKKETLLNLINKK